MRQGIEFQIDPMQIPAVALAFARTRQMATDYATRYVEHEADHGTSLMSFVHQAGIDVYPARMMKMHGERSEFRILLRAEIKRLMRRTNRI